MINVKRYQLIRHFRMYQNISNIPDEKNGKATRLAKKSTKKEQQTQSQSQSQIVNVSRSKKYHRIPDCCGMKHYTEMTLNEAIAKGAVPCKDCY